MIVIFIINIIKIKKVHKYGIYRIPDWAVNYGSDFVLQKQVVYYSGVRVSSTREGLKIK